MEHQFDTLKPNDINPYRTYYYTPNDKCKRFTPLMRLTLEYKKYGDAVLDKIKNLLKEHSRLINWQNEHGFTPLMVAAINANTYSSIKVVKLLLSYKGCRTDYRTKDKYTTLKAVVDKYKTCGNVNIDVIILFIERCKLFDKDTVYFVVKRFMNHKIIRAFIEIGMDINMVAGGGFTLLVHAIKRDNHKCIKLLLDCGADINNAGASTATPLIIAIYRGIKFKSIKMLIERGADINRENKKGTTALFYAIHRIELLKLLVDNGANIDHQNKQGLTPLMVAVQVKNVNAVDFLLKNGCDINMCDKYGYDIIYHSTKVISNIVHGYQYFSRTFYTTEKDCLDICKKIMYHIPNIVQKFNTDKTRYGKKKYKRLHKYNFDEFFKSLANLSLIKRCVRYIEQNRHNIDKKEIMLMNKDIRKLLLVD